MATPSPVNSYDGLLGHRLAKHLLARATFSVSKKRIEEYANMTVSDAVDLLFDYTYAAPDPDQIVDYQSGMAWLHDPVENRPDTNQAYLRRAMTNWLLDEAKSENTIRYKLAFFAHLSFTVSIHGQQELRVYEYLKLLLYFSKGSYKELAYHMSKDNLMLSYLDGDSNRTASPNENYAREFFELFTIGKGEVDGVGSYTTFTEHDVLQASKLFTGWVKGTWGDHVNLEDDNGNIIYGGRAVSAANYHDSSDKTFSSKFGGHTIAGSTNADVELSAFVDMIFEQEATAANICRRLYRYFVGDNITDEVENNYIQPLAAYFKTENYSIEALVKAMLKSAHFYDMDDDNAFDEVIGGLVKSPFDLMLNALNYFKVPVPNRVTDTQNFYIFYFTELSNLFSSNSGLNPFTPTSVAGYSAYYQAPSYSRDWFNTTSYLPRYKFGEMMVTGKRSFINVNTTSKIKIDLLDFINDTDYIPDPTEAVYVVTTLLDDLFPEGYDNERYNYFLNDVFLNGLRAVDWKLTWDAYVNNGNDVFTFDEAQNEIQIRLANLIKAIIQSPEYQLF